MAATKTVKQASLDALEAINAQRRLPAGQRTDVHRIAMNADAHETFKSLSPKERGTIVEAGLAALEDHAATPA